MPHDTFLPILMPQPPLGVHEALSNFLGDIRCFQQVKASQVVLVKPSFAHVCQEIIIAKLDSIWREWCETLTATFKSWLLLSRVRGRTGLVKVNWSVSLIRAVHDDPRYKYGRLLDYKNEHSLGQGGEFLKCILVPVRKDAKQEMMIKCLARSMRTYTRHYRDGEECC